MSSTEFNVFPTTLNETQLAQKAKEACGLVGTDIVSCEMLQDGAVKLPKIEIASTYTGGCTDQKANSS